MERMKAEDLSRDAADSAARKIGDFVSGVKEQATKLKRKSFDDLCKGSLDYVKDNPGKTIAISVALGLALGVMLRRRGD